MREGEGNPSTNERAGLGVRRACRDVNSLGVFFFFGGGKEKRQNNKIYTSHGSPRGQSQQDMLRMNLCSTRDRKRKMYRRQNGTNIIENKRHLIYNHDHQSLIHIITSQLFNVILAREAV